MSQLSIRRLDPIADAQLFETSFSWLEESPRWRRHAEDVFGTLDHDEYIASRLDERRVDIGLFDRGLFVAKVVLHLAARNTYEVSLESSRDMPPADIVVAGRLIRDQLFGMYGAQLAFAWVPRWAKGVQHILTAIGFVSTGVTMLRGTSRGRLIEWLQFTLRVDDVQQKQTDHHPADHSGAEPGV